MAQDARQDWQAIGSGIGAGYAWKGNDKVAAYLDAEDQPEQLAVIQAAHEAMLDLLSQDDQAAFRFIDLGAGAGAVAASLMARFPRAVGVLAELSEPMIDAGRQKLAQFDGRYRYVQYDMNLDDWPSDVAGPVEAVLSARAIHHLTDPRKGIIFKRVYDVLAPGGVFVNWDLFREPTEPQKPSHPVATVDMQLDLMRQAGFSAVACYHEVGRRKVFFGMKHKIGRS